jgi:isopenicillin N synthase-like dioxygenase
MIDAEKLITDGKVYVPYPQELRIAVAEAMETWIQFCALPEETRTQFPYETDGSVSGNGYELKTHSGKTLDQKEDFHLRINAREVLLAHAKKIGSRDIETFIEAALKLPELIAPILVAFAKAVEARFGVVGFAEDVAVSTPNLLVRFLHYFGNDAPGQEIASPHIDKGGFTLHLYESDGGVEQLTKEGEWIPIPLGHEQTVILPAIGLQHKLHSEVKALCHRVVATHESAVNGRFSAVCFVDFRNNKHFDKQKFGRLQDRIPGFNYNILWDEFDAFFVK